jgi:ABC-type phosphate transport system substrate-binding protein
MSFTSALFSLLLGAAMALQAKEPLAIIVHPDSGITRLTRDEATNLFMGRQKRLAPGLVALPVEPAPPSDTRTRFYRLLVDKDENEINAYWARLYFSGQAQPPRRAQNAAEMLEMVAANKGAVGVVERSRADKRVRVVLVLGQEGP